MPHRLKHLCRKGHRRGFCYMYGIFLYGNVQSPLRITAVFFVPTQNLRPYRNDPPWQVLPWDAFKAGLPYTAEPVITIRFCDPMTGTLADNAHTGRAALALCFYLNAFSPLYPLVRAVVTWGLGECQGKWRHNYCIFLMYLLGIASASHTFSLPK